MPVSFLVDTDWVIDHFNHVVGVTQRLQELQKEGFAVSIISVAELWEGVHYSNDPKRSQSILQEFLSGVILLGIDEEICRQFASSAAPCAGKGDL